jgi:hypothetical protein
MLPLESLHLSSLHLSGVDASEPPLPQCPIDESLCWSQSAVGGPAVDYDYLTHIG